MSWLEIIVLALIQGLTEFLPVSSSAHLILPSQVLGWADQGLAFDVAVHIGTLLAVVLYFRQDIISLTQAWCRQVAGKGASEESRLAWAVVIGTVPAVVFGLAFADFIEEDLRSVLVIAVTTIVFGVLLGFADKARGTRTISQLTLKDAVLVGLAQAIALVPGVSRSGITMTAALFLGLDRIAAARFSFLLSIPLILAAGSHQMLELANSGDHVAWLQILVGAAVSFISALACIHLFLKLLQQIGFMPFVWYRMVLGLGLLYLVFLY
ncbi:undecaprenyl-diphosphate phosphatase [Allohahella marinimesophila]|uniref:Undecaprenyl-diphosphatase n=1 Tax=Allohahella marinimesophila TaxID=1054972 RepID=A0ABP7NPM0_9GAMM